jgi:hypothetical protein
MQYLVDVKVNNKVYNRAISIMQTINNYNDTRKKPTIIKRVVKIIATGSALLGYLLLTQPDQLPILGLLLPFILLYGLIFQVILLIMQRSAPQVTAKKVSLAAVISALPVILLILSSLNQLSGWDIVVVLFFATGVYIYLQYFNLSTKD